MQGTLNVGQFADPPPCTLDTVLLVNTQLVDFVGSMSLAYDIKIWNENVNIHATFPPPYTPMVIEVSPGDVLNFECLHYCQTYQSPQSDSSITVKTQFNLALVTSDLNNDSLFDFIDYSIFLDYWLQTPDPCEPNIGDVTGDGRVDIYDFAVFVEYWLRCLVTQAFNQEPNDGEIDVNRFVVLGWSAGENAESHDVYFGTDFNDVNEADITDANVYMGNQYENFWDTDNYDVNGLDYNTTYYWRIDEVAGCKVKGDVWSFTTYDVNLGLVSLWKFDEGSGDTAYDSAGNNDANIYGAEWTTGQMGGALSFDGLKNFNGDDDWVLVGDKDSLEQQKFTLSFWAQLDNLSSKFAQGGVTKGSRYWEEEEFSYSMDFIEGFMRAGITNTANEIFGSSIMVGDRQWHMWSMTVRGGTLKIYKDGALVHSQGYTGTIDYNKNGNNFTIGAKFNGWYTLDGKMDDVRFYKRDLSSAEIEQLYLEGLGYRASNPSPADGAVGFNPNAILSWTPGTGAISHDVYLGTSFDNVNDANTSSTVYMGNFDVNSFDPCDLEKATTYYWRVDELDGPHIYKGDVWSFTTVINSEPNLVSLWKFDEGSGNTAYDSVSSNHAVINGAAWTTGQIDGAVEFEGWYSGDYVVVPDHDSLTPSDEMTVSSWIYINEVYAYRTAVLCKNYDQLNDRSWALELDAEFPPDPDPDLVDITVCWRVSEQADAWVGKETCGTTRLKRSQWYHIVATFETDHQEIYIDGVREVNDVNSLIADSIADNNQPLYIGYRIDDYPDDVHFNGVIDESRIYNRALSAEQIQQLYQQGLGATASKPSPADGKAGVDPNTILNWTLGEGALSHDVYLGTDYNDVYDANTSSPEFKGNFDVSSFDPCVLETATTYYWRIDELDGSNIYKGDVWSFKTWVMPNFVGWWKFDEGSGGIAYDSAGLNHGSVNGATWTTGIIDGALDFDGLDDYVLVNDDDSLDFESGDSFSFCLWIRYSTIEKGNIEKFDGYCGGYGIGINGPPGSISFYTWALSGKITADDMGGYNDSEWHFVCGVRDQSEGMLRLYVDGLLKDEITEGSRDLRNSTGLTIGCNQYPRQDTYFDGQIDDVRIYDRALSAVEIENLYHRELDPKASNPNPADGATGVDPNVVLSWSPGKDALSHDVYLGTDYNDVNDANTSSPEYMGNFDVNNYDPCGLEEVTTYYWRIDELDDSNTYKGEVWSFTTWEPFDHNLNLVSWWEFEEGSGDIAYDSVGSNHGSVNGPIWITGIFDGALDFDGIDDHVLINDDDSLDFGPGESFSLCVWLKYSTTEGGRITKRSATSETGYAIFVNTPTGSVGRISFHTWTAGQPVIAAYDGGYNDLNWHFVCGVRDQSEGVLRLYIDGSLKDELPESTRDLRNSGNLSLGSTSNIEGGFYEGLMDDVRLYDRALSAEEIEELYLMGN